jgi:predicted permease
MRALLERWLRRIAGPDLAEDMLGDVAERRGSEWTLVPLILSVIVARTLYAVRSHGRSRPRLLVNEARHAARVWRRAAGHAFAVSAVVGLTGTLATVGFAIADGVLFRPLPISDPAHLFVAHGPGGAALSMADADAWRAAVPSAQFALFGRDFVLGSLRAQRPEAIRALAVDAELFELLGTHPAIGAWTADDFEPQAGAVRVMISDRVWRRYFGADADVIGSRLNVAGAADAVQRPDPRSFEVAGVLRPDFVFPVNDVVPDVLLPLALAPDRWRSRNEASGRALVRTSLPVTEVAARLTTAFEGNGTVEGEPTPPPASLQPISSYLSRLQYRDLASAFSGSAVLMILALINIVSLSILRAESQHGELVIRRTLGATPVDLARVAVADALAVTMPGLVAALVATPAALALALRALPDDLVLIKPAVIDARVWAFWLCLVLIVVSAVAVARVVVAARAITGRGAWATVTSRRPRLRAALALQLTLALAVSVTGTLIVASLWRLRAEPVGYALDHRTLLEIRQDAGSPDGWRARAIALLDRIRATHGVRDAALVDGGEFLTRSSIVMSFAPLSGRTTGRAPGAWFVSARAFEVLEVHAHTGRVFTEQESDGREPVVVISDTVAHRFFQARSAVGEAVLVAGQRRRVVGVVPDVQTVARGVTNRGQIFLPPTLAGQRLTVLIHGDASVDQVAEIAAASGLGVMRAVTLKAALDRANQDTIMRAALFSVFSIVALVVVATGMFGVAAMSASRRTRELAIRSALGASRHRLCVLFAREQLAVILAGLLGGSLLALWSTRLVSRMLFKTATFDPVLWATAAALLAGVTVAAAAAPTMRATRVDPVRVLRES